MEATKSGPNIPQFSTRYQLRAKLGAGGLGVVYLGYDNVLNKDVAVKLLLPSLRPETMVRFHKEARTAAKVDHPNVLKVLDFGQSPTGELYLVMDYIDGISLEELIKTSGRLQLKTAIEIFSQICDGLQHAHSQDVLHRDIKPSNIMLAPRSDGTYQVKIVDFGLAKLESDDQKLTTTGVRVGSPLYMSPEQARAEEVDHRSDIYSLGCLMFVALTGEPPLKGPTHLETISKHICEAPPRLNDLFETPQFPGELEDILEKSLCKDAEGRFQSAKAVKQALLEMQENLLQASSVVPTSEQRPRFLRFAFIAIILGAIATTSIFVYPLLDAPRSKDDHNFKYHPIAGHPWLIASGKLHAGGIKKIESYVEKDGELRLILHDPKVSDSDLKYICPLPMVALDVSGTRISDQGLTRIVEMPWLRALILNYDKNITNAGVALLAARSKLTIIGLRGTSIDESAVEKLSKMTGLVSLDLSEMKSITRNSLKYLQRAPKLVGLRVGNTSVTGADLVIFREYPRLKCLSLSHLKLNDGDIKVFADARFGSLDLSYNADITDAGLKSLRVKDMVVFNVMGCSRVTEDYLSQLAKECPDTLIYSDLNTYRASEKDRTLPDKWMMDPGRGFYDPECMQMWGATEKIPSTFSQNAGERRLEP